MKIKRMVRGRGIVSVVLVAALAAVLIFGFLAGTTGDAGTPGIDVCKKIQYFHLIFPVFLITGMQFLIGLFRIARFSPEGEPVFYPAPSLAIFKPPA
jgi:hypothetical protein